MFWTPTIPLRSAGILPAKYNQTNHAPKTENETAQRI